MSCRSPGVIRDKISRCRDFGEVRDEHQNQNKCDENVLALERTLKFPRGFTTQDKMEFFYSHVTWRYLGMLSMTFTEMIIKAVFHGKV